MKTPTTICLKEGSLDFCLPNGELALCKEFVNKFFGFNFKEGKEGSRLKVSFSRSPFKGAKQVFVELATSYLKDRMIWWGKRKGFTEFSVFYAAQELLFPLFPQDGVFRLYVNVEKTA